MMMSENGLYSSSPPSHSGSQSSLIRRSVASESDSINGGYINTVVRPGDHMLPQHVHGGQDQKSREPPPSSAARPRPTSAQREISMSNVVLETKM